MLEMRKGEVDVESARQWCFNLYVVLTYNMRVARGEKFISVGRKGDRKVLQASV